MSNEWREMIDADIRMIADAIAQGIARALGRLPANAPVEHCEERPGNGVTLGGAARK
jgi:hypothetical protein